MENKEEKKTVDILPLGVGKRILLFLADFFINFILAFLVMNIVTTPIAKGCTSFNSRNTSYSLNLLQRADILYGNKLLFNSGDVERYEIVYNTEFTYRCYLSYFTFDEEKPLGMIYDQYGHKTENDVLKHYFVDLMSDETKFISLFDSYNKQYNYFTRNNLNITLNNEIREQISPYFIKNGVVTSTATTYINNIESSLFTPMVCEMYASISKNDLMYEGHSYNQTQAALKSFENYFNTMITYSAFAAVLISSFILYFVIPICNKNRKTIGMMLMRIERVNFYRLTKIKKYDVFMTFVYQFLLSFLIAFFIPIGYLTFIEIFKVAVLLIFALLSIMLMLMSMVFLFINKFNRTMFDYFTRTVYLTNAELDEIYRAKGYQV